MVRGLRVILMLPVYRLSGVRREIRVGYDEARTSLLRGQQDGEGGAFAFFTCDFETSPGPFGQPFHYR